MKYQIDYTKLAQEIAQNIPEPQPGAETWVYGLLVISGWAVAAVALYLLYKAITKMIDTMQSISTTMAETNIHLTSQTQLTNDLIEKINSHTQSHTNINAKLKAIEKTTDANAVKLDELKK
jgi:septal ring factor EnvC (AmiA/AmiB activator)